MTNITCAYHVEVWYLSSVNRSSGGAEHRALYSRFIVHGAGNHTLKKIDQNESCQKMINSLLALPSSPRQRRARWELCESPGRCKQSFAQWEPHVCEGSGNLVAMKRIPNKNYFDVREHETKIYGWSKQSYISEAILLQNPVVLFW